MSLREGAPVPGMDEYLSHQNLEVSPQISAHFIINKTKDQSPLDLGEIDWWITEVTNGRVPKHLISAWLSYVTMRGKENIPDLSGNEKKYIEEAKRTIGVSFDKENFKLEKGKSMIVFPEPEKPEGVSALSVLEKTREGTNLTKEEIFWFINEAGKKEGGVADYQFSAWLAFLDMRGKQGVKPVTDEETVNLTFSMAYSGEVMDMSEFPKSADKHSSGGIGDKTSLIVLPIIAACGIPAGKLSGRGLGFTGGTVDKWESIPGFRTELTKEEFKKQLKEIGIVSAGQSKNLAPADKILYGLRDVTGNVPSIPLIASSIMSKKIAGGAESIVLDVKVGKGAFMTTIDKARELSTTMVAIGKTLGKKMVAVLSDMNQPLGGAVGNANEVFEAIRTLQGYGRKDLVDHCVEIAAWSIYLSKKADSLEDARKLAREKLEDKSAWIKFGQLVEAQGGDLSYINNPNKLFEFEEMKSILITAKRSGYISQIDALEIGEIVKSLGGGRQKEGDAIDHQVGVYVARKVGDRINEGDDLSSLRVRSVQDAKEFEERLYKAISLSNSFVDPLPLFYGTVE